MVETQHRHKTWMVPSVLAVLILVACSESSAPTSSGSAVKALSNPYVCSAKALFHPEIGNVVDGGATLEKAQAAALADCRLQAGEIGSGCVLDRCGYGADSGGNDLKYPSDEPTTVAMTGPAVCEWQDLRTGGSGYTDGDSRAAAREGALKDCHTGPAHPTGIDCIVLECIAKGADKPFGK